MAKKKAMYDDKGKLIIPDNLIGITKEFMLLYLEESGTVDDIDWFENLLATTEKKKYKNPVNGETEEPDRAEVRKAFVKHFSALKNLDPDNKEKKKETIEDRLKAMRKKKQEGK